MDLSITPVHYSCLDNRWQGSTVAIQSRILPPSKEVLRSGRKRDDVEKTSLLLWDVDHQVQMTQLRVHRDVLGPRQKMFDMQHSIFVGPRTIRCLLHPKLFLSVAADSVSNLIDM